MTTATARLAAPALATGFGVLMVGAAAVGSHGAAIGVAAAGLLAVAVGTVYRPAATLAVLLAAAAVLLSAPAAAFVALSGLCAAAYLVCRSGIGGLPTAVGAGGFAFVGLVAASFPLQLPWLPLIAPLGVLAIYVLAAIPFLG